MLYCSDEEDQDGSEYQYDVHMLEHELMHYEIQGRSRGGWNLSESGGGNCGGGRDLCESGGRDLRESGGRDLCESGGGCGLPLVGGY